VSERRKYRVLVVASPFPISGGGLRALRSLREYVKYYDTSLVIPWSSWDDKDTLRDSIVYLRGLRNLGVKLIGFSKLPNILYKVRRVLSPRIFSQLIPLTLPGMVKCEVLPRDYDAIVVLHECLDAVCTGRMLAEYFNVPSMVLLQLPPFYGSKERFLNILKALLLWREFRSNSKVEEVILKVEALAREVTIEYMSKYRIGGMLRKYNLIISISKAIPIEMGSEWVERIVPLDPGVSLDDEDLLSIKSVKMKIKDKEDYLVFGGRPEAGKGLIEALLVFKQITKYKSNLKLFITGKISKELLMRMKMICKKLGIGDKVVFTGFISRRDRFEIVAKAKLMLYPSHIDAFPYAVLESLHLGTPVIAYRIPALEIYYGGTSGVELVDEWNLESFTVKAIDILEKGVEVIEPPKIKSWDEIMDEEVGIVQKLITTGKST